MEEPGIILVCKHCLYKWTYQGHGIYWTSCPRCRANVKLTGG